ncbi:MAG: hypothetical protein RLY58_102 [Pseudomonadota bacterium]
MNAFVADSPLSLAVFRKTPRAHAELANRERHLSSRLRQLLLLLDKNDSASARLRDSLMTPENLDVLLRLELIEPIQTSPDATTVIRSTEIPPFSQPMPAEPVPHVIAEPEPFDSVVITVELPVDDTPQHDPLIVRPDMMSLADTQALMIDSLRQSCGLLAVGLMRDIASATTDDHLRRCQARWKMTLLDSRTDRAQIEQWIQTVSLALSLG